SPLIPGHQIVGIVDVVGADLKTSAKMPDLPAITRMVVTQSTQLSAKSMLTRFLLYSQTKTRAVALRWNHRISFLSSEWHKVWREAWALWLWGIRAFGSATCPVSQVRSLCLYAGPVSS